VWFFCYSFDLHEHATASAVLEKALAILRAVETQNINELPTLIQQLIQFIQSHRMKFIAPLFASLSLSVRSDCDLWFVVHFCGGDENSDIRSFVV
jgi:hypothetical protein